MLPSISFDGQRDGPYLVLLNALGTTNLAWDEVVRSLASDYGIVRIELPGHGISPVPNRSPAMGEIAQQVREALDRLGIRRASFAGCSLGGMIAQQFVADNDGFVDALVLIGTQAKAGTAEYWQQRIADTEAGGLAEVAEVVIPRWFSQSFIERSPAAVEYVRSMLLACDLSGYTACMQAIAGFDSRGWLAKVTAPVMVICGDSDSTMTVDSFTEFASLFREARLEILPGAGHLVHVEEPDAVAQLMGSHLRRASAGAL